MTNSVHPVQSAVGLQATVENSGQVWLLRMTNESKSQCQLQTSLLGWRFERPAVQQLWVCDFKSIHQLKLHASDQPWVMPWSGFPLPMHRLCFLSNSLATIGGHSCPPLVLWRGNLRLVMGQHSSATTRRCFLFGSLDTFSAVVGRFQPYGTGS